jgi:sialate O-acetylesterase
VNILVKRIAGLIWVVLILATASRAEVRLSNMFSDRAVLQRDQPVHVWGWAAPRENVTVHFHGQTREAIADDIGAWQVWLMPEKAGGPYVLSVSGSETEKPVERHDILVGDVWVASGQSNMEFPLKGFSTAKLKNGDQEIADANHPRMRLLLVERAVSDSPLSDVNGEWTDCTPETAADFSAVAYFFGREISERENVPVGLIDSTWGGTPAQAWVSMDALGADDFSAAMRDEATVMQQQAFSDQIRANFAAQNEVLKAEGKSALTFPHVSGDYRNPRLPAVLFNGMIAPLTSYTIKGVIWYQGESDSPPQRAGNYARLFPLLITDWRHYWGEGDFPFLFVQISSFTSPKEDWGQIRDAQRRTLALRDTEMAVTLDIGDAHNVHPSDKQTVGTRLALAALGSIYGEKNEFASPEFLQATIEGSAIRVWLTHAEGLSSRSMPLGGFEVAGADHKFTPADARIEILDSEVTVVVSSPLILEPRYVRYGWANVVTDYLYNSAGLPLGTFTSE